VEGCDSIRKTLEKECLQSKRGIIQLTIIFGISLLDILTFAIPYAIARVVIKDERKRIYGCMVCFILWLLASCYLLIQASLIQLWVILPFTLETFALLMIILSYDLFMQIRSL